MTDLTSMTALAMSLGELSARLIQSFLELLDSSLVTAITEKVLLFCVWDFVDAAVRLVETSYKVAAELLQSRSADGCSKESGSGHRRTELKERSAQTPRSDGAESPMLADPAATGFEEISIDENPLTQRFDRLADGLWLFLDIYDRVRRFGEEEPYDSHAWGLRDFLKEVPEGRRLALLEDTFSLARKTEMSWDTKVTWCTALVASLTFVQQNVSSALELSSSMFLRYRKLMRLEQTFDVPTHLAFLERVPQWFDEMPVFMNSIGHSRPDRAELLFSRSSRLCTAENSSRLQTSRPRTQDGLGEVECMLVNREMGLESRELDAGAWEVGRFHRLLGLARPRGSDAPGGPWFWRAPGVFLELHLLGRALPGLAGAALPHADGGALRPDGVPAGAGLGRLRLHGLGQGGEDGGQVRATEVEGAARAPDPFRDPIPARRRGGAARTHGRAGRRVASQDPVSRDIPRKHEVEMLRAESMTISKLVYVAINPLLPPPALAEPNFTIAFAGYWRKSPEQLARGAVAAQCSLASTTEVLRPLSYSLLQVEHLYAVYVHSALAEMAPDEMKEFEEWRLGWFCSPLSRYLMGLEASEASGAQGCAEAEAAKEALPTLRRFWARAEKAGGSHGADCPVPYRGPWCQDADRSMQDEARPYRAAVHYVVNEDAEHLKELLFSIESLWVHFNERFDYPVLIFHDGLSPKTRESIVAKTPGQRIWFFSVGNWVPSEAQHALHSNFGAGYMAQSRFRSGPVFHHEALDGFDYLWSLDSDSHFPAPVEVDPFLQLHSNPELVMGWSYITTTSPASVRRLWEYTMLYAMKEKVDIWSSTLSKNWKSGRTHFMSTFLSSSSVEGLDRMPLWNNRVLMTDCEVLRLSFFRSSRYQDYFQYLDSLEGFWSHRWGDHAVRTLGVGLALWEEDRPTWQQAIGRGSDGWPRAFQMVLPYAHQDFCQCDGECRPLHDPKRGVVFDELQGLRKKFWTCLPEPPDKDAEPRASPLLDMRCYANRSISATLSTQLTEQLSCAKSGCTCLASPPGLSEWTYDRHSRLLFGADLEAARSGPPPPELVLAFLDDVCFAGDYRHVAAALNRLAAAACQFGLELNPGKCEVVTCAGLDSSVDMRAFPAGVQVNPTGAFSFLGAPIAAHYCEAFMMTERVGKARPLLRELAARPTYPDVQTGLLLLRLCTLALDTCALGHSPQAWEQASLATSVGGLGLRLANLHAPAAYIASLTQTVRGCVGLYPAYDLAYNPGLLAAIATNNLEVAPSDHLRVLAATSWGSMSSYACSAPCIEAREQECKTRLRPGCRGHVRLLLQQFMHAVHDCRQAIDQDPKIFKAHLDAASFHSSLCEDGTRFCDAGLQQANLRQYLWEQLVAQQQREDRGQGDDVHVVEEGEHSLTIAKLTLQVAERVMLRSFWLKKPFGS
eukprot:s7298_g3.t6